MRVLLVTPEYPPKNIGGGGIAYRSLAKELRKQGHTITLFAGDFLNRGIFGEIKHFSDDGVEVFFLPLIPAPKTKNINSLTYTPPTLSAIIFLTHELKRNTFDIVHLHGVSHPLIDITALFCILFRKRYVFTCHGIPKSPEIARPIFRSTFKAYLSTFAKLLFRSARIVTTVSYALLQECKKAGLTNNKMVVIPNGWNRSQEKVEPTVVERVEEKYSLKGKKLIFSVGRLARVKGFQHLVEAMPSILCEVPDAISVIAGSGPYGKKLEDLARGKNLSDYVKLIGFISEEEKAALYHRADVVVFPSLYEPFGIVALEAMSAGKSIVASNVGGFLELFKNKKIGFIIKPGNSEEIADKTIFVLTHDLLRKEIEKSAFKEAASYSWNKIAKYYVEIYYEACARRLAT